MKKNNVNEIYLNSDLRNYKDHEKNILGNYKKLIEKDLSNGEIVLYNFPRYVRHQEVTRFLVCHELFKRIKNIHGSIIQVGVLDGNKLFSFAHFSEIYEPRNYTRKIYGFDTFNSYAENSFSSKDKKLKKGTRSAPFNLKNLEEHVDLFNQSCIFNQFKKIELIKGDVVKTIPNFLKKNKHIVCSLLDLSISLYKPELVTLKNLWPRMPKGSVVLFGSLGHYDSPSATHLLQDTLKISNVKIQRFDFATKHSFIVKE